MKLKTRAMRLLVIPIVFSLLFGDAALIFAQETTTSDSSAPSEASASTQEQFQTTTKSQPGSDQTESVESQLPKGDVKEENGGQSLEILSAEGEPVFRDQSTDVQRLSYQPNANGATGALNYEYPIVVPPGRGKMTPDIRLRYSNQGTENSNIFGYGWADNIPYIERQNKKGSEDLYSNYFFYSTLSGELASTSATEYSSRVEDGNFYKYTFSNNGWVVKDKFGYTYSFGSTTATRLDNPASSTQVYKWMLQEVRDPNDNYIKYEYTKDSGQIYPYKITYTGSGSTDGIFEIEFLKQLRSDVATSSKPAFEVVTKYRINEVYVKENGTWTRKYTLGYSTGNNGTRSVLSSATEHGRDDSLATTSLPAVNFTYQNPTTPNFTENSNLRSPIPLINIDAGGGARDEGVRLVDINTDGLTDIVQSKFDGYSSTSHAYINNGNGYYETPQWFLPAYITSEGAYGVRRDEGTRLVDINGDGRTDVIQYNIRSDSTSTTTYAYINNGNGFTNDSTWYSPVPFIVIHAGFGEYMDNGVRVFDINGDGLNDIIQALDEWNGSSWDLVAHSYINTGSGFVEDSNWNSPIAFVRIAANGYSWERYDRGVRPFDINGDGLTDIVQSYRVNDGGAEVRHTYINTGSGFVETPMWDLPLSFNNYMGGSVVRDYGVRIMDINGDGLLDVVKSLNENESVPATSNKKVHLNTGSGFAADNSNWYPPLYFHNTFLDRWRGVQPTDLNGDTFGGQIVNHTDGENYAYINNTNRADFLSRVTLAKGGSLGFSYKTSSQYFNGSTTTSPLLPLNIQTVEKIASGDGMGNYATTTYTYYGGEFYYSSSTPFDRKFAGFASTTESDPASNKTITYFHQGNTTDSSNGEYSDHFSKIGRPFRVEKKDANNNTYAIEVNKWDKYAVGTSSDFVKLVRNTKLSYDGDSDHRDKAEEYSYIDTNGNMVLKTAWGEVTGSTDGSFTDTGTDKLTFSTNYATNTTAYILSLPATTTLKDQSGNKISESRYYYDSQSIGSVNKGNVTKEEKWKSASSYASTTKTYNSYGLVTQEADPRGKITTYTYDTYNLYPATTTNPLSQTFAYTYDYSAGKPKQIKDPNNLILQTVFDGLDRVKEEKQPDQTTPSTLVTKTSYIYTDNTVPTVVQKTDNLNSATSTDTYTYIDGLNRPIQERKEGEESYAVRDFSYNSLGLIQNESLPYFSAGLSRTTATTTSSLYTTYTYDSIKRVSAVGNALGTTTNAYDDWVLTVTDPLSKVKKLYKDAYDRLNRVDEVFSTTTYTTNYEYDGNNSLTKITDANGNVRNFTYDGLGRRLTAQDLHAAADGTYGTWSFTYDDSGNLTAMTDPKSQNYSFTYDDINRVTVENYTGAAGNEVTYSYDTCTYGKPRLCQAAFAGSATTTYTYAPTGQAASEVKTIDSTNYTTSFTYDRLGNKVKITYPDNSEVQYIYNNAGFLEKLQQKKSGGSNFGNLVSDFDYAPTGKVTYKNFTNGTESVYTYDATKLYRLTNILTMATSTESEPAGGDLGFLYAPNLAFLYESNLSSDPAAYKLFAFNFSRLAQATDAGFGDQLPIQSVTTTTDPVVINIATTTVQLPVISPEPVATSTEPIATSTEPLATTTGSVATSTPSSGDTASTTAITNLDSAATSTATTTSLVATTTSEILAVATSTELVDETLKVKDGKASKFTDNDDNYEFVFSQKNKNAGKASAKALKDRPEVRLTKWDGQVDVGISYKKVKGNGSYKSSGDRIEWKDSKEELHAYPLSANGQMEDGGFEIEVYLKDKPDTNVFDFEIDGAEKLDFFYQPELTQEEIDEGAVRPENVVGSYAVYHKTKKDYEMGGMNYETGKVFHIFRPKAIDASGNEVWGTLSYENGVLSVTIPQDFLDKADYPVRVDPTFGYMTAGASGSGYDYSTASDAALGDEYNLPVAGTIQSITAHAGAFNTPSGTNARFLVTSGGLSSTLQGVSAGFLNESSSRIWTTKNLTSPLSLSSGNYILGFQGDNREIAMSYDTASGQVYQINTTADFSASPGSGITWSNSASVDRKFSIYATYTTSQTNWQYRKQITLNGASGAGSNYQVLLKVGESSGASGEDFDLGSHAQSFPTVEGSSADMMFTKDDGSTELDFWVEDVTGTSPNRLAYVWVKVSDDLSTNKNIYVYYGNAGTLKTSNGANTFNFFDNFDDGAIDRQKWTTICSSGCDVTAGSSSSVTESGDTLKQFDAAVANSQGRIVATSSPFNTDGYAIKRRFRRVDNGTYANSTFGFGADVTSHTSNGTTSPTIHNANFENRVELLATGMSSQAIMYNSDLTQSTWYRQEARRTSATAVSGQLWSDTFSSLASYSTTTSSVTDNEYPVIRSGDGHDVETDWVFVRRYESTEPTFSSAGSEESLSQGGGGGGPVIQNISFTYDAVGNITGITDYSDTGTGKTLIFGYDDLYRLTSASTTAASSTPYHQTFDYSSIGNIQGWKTNTSATSTYAYAGTNYANPHAATSIGGSSLSYDNNGNLTSYGSTTMVWDYRNRMTEVNTGTGTTTYAYDHNNQRVKKVFGGVTTVYPNMYFNKAGATTTRHIYDNEGGLIATIEGNGTATSTYYIHTDHLGGTNVLTNASGTAVEVTDYYPFGTQRVATGSYDDQRKFTGHEYDTSSDLTYANQRYYDQDVGRWTGQDSAFLATGNEQQLKQATNLDQQRYLADPQGLNSYAYARNNPIKLVDKNGNYFETAFDIAMLALSINDFRNNPSWGNAFAVGADAASLALPIPAIVGGLKHSDDAAKFLKGADKVSDGLRGTDKANDIGKVFISESRYQHVIDRHTLEGSKFIPGKSSYFNPNVDVRSLIENASKHEGKLNSSGYHERVVDFGKDIGVDRATGKQTSIYTVITDTKGNLITSHPGQPGKPYKSK